MKKLITLIGLCALAITAFAQTPSIATFKFMPLLSGYNVLVATNLTYGAASLAQSGVASITATNVLYTSYNGQVLYSYSNNVNGGLSTNAVAPDAFKWVKLTPDANNDINANASVIIMIGNTNLLPVVATNSIGQFFIPTVTTNGAFPFLAGPNPTVWPLGVASGPSWMYPGTTNFYPNFTAGTNPVVVSLYRAHAYNLKGTGEATLDPRFITWETASAFSFTVSPNVGITGATTLTVITNLPSNWLQGANYVAATVTATPLGALSQGVLLNQLGIMQPQ